MQKVYQSTVGAEVDLPQTMTATTTLFRNAFRNTSELFAISNDDGLFGDRVSLDGRAYGVELSLRRKFTNRIGGFASYTLSRNERYVFRTYVPNGFDRTHVANLAMSFDLGRDKTTDIPITIVPNDKIDLSFRWNDYVFFRTDTVPGATLQFEGWALADKRGNGDGVITASELESVFIGNEDFPGSVMTPGRYAVSSVSTYPRGFSGRLSAYVAGQAPFGWTRIP